MATTIVISQSAVLPPVVQGTYRWLLAQQRSESDLLEPREEAEADWSFETPSGFAEQYELFEPYIDEQAVFQMLVHQWRIERGSSSSTTEIVLCPAYQAIIGMGPVAIHLIMAQMESEGQHPDQWFWALQVLTKADPVREEDEGNFPQMARSWLQWARSRYVW